MAADPGAAHHQGPRGAFGKAIPGLRAHGIGGLPGLVRGRRRSVGTVGDDGAMSFPTNADSPGTGTERVWKWRVARQWRASRRVAMAQLACFFVGGAILVWLWMPPNDAIAVVVQVGVTVLWGYFWHLLFGPYRTPLH